MIDEYPIFGPNYGEQSEDLIRCDKCGLSLAVGSGRRLRIGHVVVYCSIQLECAECRWAKWWYPAPKMPANRDKLLTV
jgi:hypothetical protein